MEKDYIYPDDLVTINGQRYIKTEPVLIKQTLPIDKFCRVTVTLPDFISSSVIYKDMLFTATKQIDDLLIRFTNTYDYWVIDFYPDKNQIKYHNSLLEKGILPVRESTEAEREQLKKEWAELDYELA